MHSMLKQLHRLTEDELMSISEAIDRELECRLDIEDPIPDSARRRAIQRSQSYRRATGSSALPVRVAGLRNGGNSRRVA